MSNELGSQMISHVSTGYALTISKIIDWAEQFTPWSSIRIDAFTVSGGAMSYLATSQNSAQKPFKALRISLKAGREIEQQLQSLHAALATDTATEQWNKVRFTYDRLKDQSFISTQWDDDYHWLNKIAATSDEYLALDMESEHKILSWEGLPKNAPRPWQKKHLRLVAAINPKEKPLELSRKSL